MVFATKQKLYFLLVFGVCIFHYGQGQYHTCFIISNQTISCWGSNELGQLGIGNFNGQYSPIPVPVLTNIIKISLGLAHTCALNSSGAFWCWGHNYYGQLGIGNEDNQHSPILVTDLTNIDKISLGLGHTCAVNFTGFVWCWGKNDFGQLGIGHNIQQNFPVLIETLSNITEISLGQFHTCAINTTGFIWCWGANDFGQLKIENNTYQNLPILLDVNNLIKEVSLGNQHTCIVDIFENVSCWGKNDEYQLGKFIDLNNDGANDDYSTNATSIISNIKRISVRGEHSCAVNNSGYLFCWGRRTETPTLIQELFNVKNIFLGDVHTCAVNYTGFLFCWGYNSYGQIGIGNSLIGQTVNDPTFVRRSIYLSISQTSTLTTSQTSTLTTSQTSTLTTSQISTFTTSQTSSFTTSQTSTFTTIVNETTSSNLSSGMIVVIVLSVCFAIFGMVIIIWFIKRNQSTGNIMPIRKTSKITNPAYFLRPTPGPYPVNNIYDSKRATQTHNGPFNTGQEIAKKTFYQKKTENTPHERNFNQSLIKNAVK